MKTVFVLLSTIRVRKFHLPRFILFSRLRCLNVIIVSAQKNRNWISLQMNFVNCYENLGNLAERLRGRREKEEEIASHNLSWVFLCWKISSIFKVLFSCSFCSVRNWLREQNLRLFIYFWFLMVVVVGRQEAWIFSRHSVFWKRFCYCRKGEHNMESGLCELFFLRDDYKNKKYLGWGGGEKIKIAKKILLRVFFIVFKNQKSF